MKEVSSAAQDPGDGKAREMIDRSMQCIFASTLFRSDVPHVPLWHNSQE